MGDRTAFQGTIHRANPVTWDQVVAEVNEYTDGDFYEPHGGIYLGEQFGASEVSCGVVDELSSRLVDIDPTIVFSMWEDPKYEWLGTAAVYVGDPEMGIYMHSCDADGRPVITESELVERGVYRAVADAPTSWQEEQAETQRKVRALFGRPHYDRLHEIAAEIAAHKTEHVIELYEQTDGGEDPGWRAYCSGCHWMSEWYLAHDYQDKAELQMKQQALARGEEVAAAENNPMQLAHDAAEHNGEQHVLHPPNRKE